MEREVDAAGFLPRAQKLETPTSSPTDSSREHSVSHESTGSSIPDRELGNFHVEIIS